MTVTADPVRRSPRIRLGINNCFAVKRWPDPEDWSTVVTDVLGLDLVQVSEDLLSLTADRAENLRTVERVRGVLDDSGIEVHSVFSGLAAYGRNLLLARSERAHAAALAWFEELIRAAHGLGGRGAGGFLGAFSVPDFIAGEAERLLARLFTDMRSLSETAQRYGLDFLLFENMSVEREYGHRIEEAKRIEASVSGAPVPWRLCLDVGHPFAIRDAHQRGGGLEPWLCEPWACTPVVQLQQTRWGQDQHAPFAGEPIEGQVEREKVLAAVSEWPADEVTLLLEIIPSHEAADDLVLEDLRASVDYWREGISCLAKR